MIFASCERADLSPCMRVARAVPSSETIPSGRRKHGHRIDLRHRNAAGAVHAAPRRRRAHSRPSAVGMVRPRADARRGHGVGQYGRSICSARRANSIPMPRKVEGKGNDEDKFAYLRDVRQYRNLLLVEQPNGDFARTMVRQFFYAAFADPVLARDDEIDRRNAGGDRGEVREGKRLSSAAFVGMDGPSRRRHRGKPSPRAGRDRRSLGLYRRDVRGDDERARPDRCRHRRRSGDAAPQWLQDGFRHRERSDARAAQKRLDAAGRPRAAGTASISGICSANCNRCSGPFRGRHGDRRAATMPSCGNAPGRPRRAWSIPRFRC